MIPLDPHLAGWLVGALSSATCLASWRRRARRHALLRDAFHELRRPLQVLQLASGRSPVDRDLAVRQLELASAALSDAEQVLTGGTPPARRSPVDARRLISEACGRWRGSAQAAGVALDVRWTGPEASVLGDPTALARALDNLVANAIEHGGPRIALDGQARGLKVRLVVRDIGQPRHIAAPGIGLGLRIVDRLVAQHGGRFALSRSERGTEAVMELPALRLEPSRSPSPVPRLAPAS